MKRWATSLRAALYLACVLPMGASAQAADPAVWGVYARLLGAKLAWDQTAALTFSWYWNGDKTAIVEDQSNGQLDTGEIKPLGNGRLARFVKGELLWSGTILPDGAVIWEPEGGFFTRRGGGPFRVRLQGDSALVDEGVVLQNGKVTQATPWRRMVGSLPTPVPAAPAPAVVAAASAPDAAASDPLTMAEAPPAEDRAGPRTLTEADLARLRGSMARDKLQRAETLKRQAEEARRQEVARRQQAESEARMAEQRAQQEREEERQSDDAFASALMGGLNTFKNEMARNQAEQAQQQAFIANLQRQQQQANEARQREQDRQRQAAAREQLIRQQQAAAAQQQRQLAAARPAQPSAAAPAAQAAQSPQARAQAEAAERERQLRENAAADRLRRQQIQDYRLAQERAAPPAQLAQNAAPQPTAPTLTPATAGATAPSSSSCRVDRVTTMAVGRNKTEASTRADVEAMAAKQCQGKGQLGPIQCSSSKDISIDSHGRQHDLGTRTYDCSAVVDCGRTREVCYGPPQSGSAQ